MNKLHENAPEKSDFTSYSAVYIPKPEWKKQTVEDLISHSRSQMKQVIPELVVNDRSSHDVLMISY